MEKYNGKMIYRLRPSKDDFIENNKETPYEIHLISFDSEEDLTKFIKDDSRLKFIHLKNDSIKSTLIVKGEKM